MIGGSALEILSSTYHVLVSVRPRYNLSRNPLTQIFKTSPTKVELECSVELVDNLEVTCLPETKFPWHQTEPHLVS